MPKTTGNLFRKKVRIMKIRLIMAAATAAVMLFGCGKKENPNSYAVDDFDSSLISESAENGSSDNGTSEANEETDSENTEYGELYDVKPIIEAYKNGDISALSTLDLAIYEKACGVLNEIVSDDMDDYEKELAVHDYIISNCTYDTATLGAIPHESENSDNPYGVLINGQAICKGYTTTFRMFMGMLGIPCGTVHATDVSGDEHAWNTVKLDGSWYYVDCTWDDPVPDSDNRLVEHMYFNVSKDFIAIEHNLPDGVPETDSVANSYANRELIEIDDYSEIENAVKTAVSENSDSVALLFDDKLSEKIDLSEADEPYNYYELFEADTELDNEINSVLNSEGLNLNGYLRVETEKGMALSVVFSRN
jgi:hypothetical protein